MGLFACTQEPLMSRTMPILTLANPARIMPLATGGFAPKVVAFLATAEPLSMAGALIDFPGGANIN